MKSPRRTTITAAQSAQITATMKVLNATDRAISTPGKIDAAWDSATTGMAKRMGIDLVDGRTTIADRTDTSPGTPTGADAAWDATVAEVNATHGLKPPPS